MCVSVHSIHCWNYLFLSSVNCLVIHRLCEHPKDRLTLCQDCSEPVKISHHSNMKKSSKIVKKNDLEITSGPGRGLKVDFDVI